MLGVRLLPFDYGIRNLFRRPGRSLLTLLGLATVVLLVLLVVSFVRGLETSLAVSGDAGVVLIHALGAQENIENSTVPGKGAAVISASISGVKQREGQKYVSPELYLGTEVVTESTPEPAMGLARGVTLGAPLVRRMFQLQEGKWPVVGEVIVGRMASAKLGRPPEDLAVGKTVRFEGRDWVISGRFSAGGSAFESELWCPVDDLQQAMKRQDLSLISVAVENDSALKDLQEFCKERVDLEWQATPEAAYYASLNRHYGPVRTVAWLIVALVSGAGIFAGMNTMFGAVVGRVRELAMLQTLGFSRRAIAISVIQEGLLLSAAGSIIAAVLAIVLLNGFAVRFTMSAFALRVDGVAILTGLCVGVVTGVIGSIPPAWRVLKMPVVDALKAV
ncbi:ABC transporter substrate-binding protein [Planctomyces sp. SCGC AG-212-M04]|nr:ABC transporter substrate-binding protein [Planctomyces sp. SCGC AG-212-M04]